ncbi:hypothetical protein FO440_02890 [Mucilaginibacter corticis]|uniref:Uncharacterized protein n=1 Tax=Mucilaginibacter corticis TaxID=2597670 RepID=A0A556MT96_9SPHI|nr:hypothetical protein [Mucilaginibacter corticis]TSJ43154.1 hypothetical protein FO440_02890 [Mucilaginibacter corticis]
MYRRDMVIDEMRRMALIIAKLLGIKATGTNLELEQEFNNILESEYNTELEKLLGLNEQDLIASSHQTNTALKS